MENKSSSYSSKEEKINIITHGFGLLLSIPATIILIIYSCNHGTAWHIVSSAIYGSSLILLYLASTVYHSAKESKLRERLNVFDHAAIYLLIAGTYTPFLLITLHGGWGWSLFGIVWGFAIIGIVMKILFSKRYKAVSAIAYVSMGCIIVVAFKPLINSIEPAGLWWLIAGGISYITGAVLYVIEKIPYNHGIFHVFVLGGSIAHWIAVFFYVL
jgi:hemolysin III